MNDLASRPAHQAATGKPQRWILAQNRRHRPGVWAGHRGLSTAAASGSSDFITEQQSRCVTITLHLTSIAPFPTGPFAALRKSSSIRASPNRFAKHVIARRPSPSSSAHGRTFASDGGFALTRVAAVASRPRNFALPYESWRPTVAILCEVW